MATLTTSWQMLGQAYLGTSGGSLYVRVYARYSEQDIANNRSYVYYQARTYYENGTYIQDAQGSGSVSGTGLSAVGGSATRPTTGEQVVATTEGWIGHDGNGNLSITCYGNLNFPNWGWNATAVGTANLPQIPRKATITSAPNFNDEENPTITYSNPAGYNANELDVCISLTGAVDDIPYRHVSRGANSYTFELTNEERDILRSATTSSNSRKIQFVIRTKIGNNVYWYGVDRTISIINANPLFDNFEWETTNYHNLTGEDNKQTVIKNYSNIKTIVSEENKATAIKKATLTSYQTTIGSKSQTNNNLTYPVETIIDKVDSATITVFANDSRGNSTPVVKPITNYIEYQKLSGSITNLARTEDVNSEVNLQFEGIVDIVNFGAIENSIIDCKYLYKNTSSSDDFIPGETTLNVTLTQIEGTKYRYEVNQNILGDLGARGFDINSSFLVKVVVNDELEILEDMETLGTGSPAIAVKGNCVSLGAPYNESIGGRVQINGASAESVGGGDTLPIGAIVDYDGDEVPEGYEILSNPTYSTEETKTGETWIDGRPIYRRVFKGTTYNHTSTTITTEINSYTVEVINVGGYICQKGSPELRLSIGGVLNSNWYVGFYSSDVNIALFHPTNLGNANYVLWIEYTKTTD